MLRSEPLQTKVQVRSNEGRVDALADERLAVERLKAGSEGVPRGARSKSRIRLNRVVTNMDDWASGGAPNLKKREPVFIRLGVPSSRPARCIEALLNVDGQKHGAIEIEIECHG